MPIGVDTMEIFSMLDQEMQVETLSRTGVNSASTQQYLEWLREARPTTYTSLATALGLSPVGVEERERVAA